MAEGGTAADDQPDLRVGAVRGGDGVSLWVEEGDGNPLVDHGWAPMRFGDDVHFVQMRDTAQGPHGRRTIELTNGDPVEVRYWPYPVRVACGLGLPDWETLQRTAITGQVTCEQCLRAREEAEA